MQLLEIIILQIRISAFFGCAPFQVLRCRQGPKVVPLNEKDPKIRWWYFWRFIVIIFCICLPLRILYRVWRPSQENNVASFLLLMVWLTISLGTYWAQSNMVERREEIPLLINSVILFQKKTGIVVKPEMTSVVALLLVIGASLSPVVLPLLSWVAPCSPQYIGNVMFDCSNPSKLTTVQSVWIYLVELVLITAGAMSTGVLTNPIVALAGLLNSYIKYVSDLQIQHKTKSPKLNEWAGNRLTNRQSILYRQLQVLMKFYNGSFQMHHMANIQCSCSAVIIGTLFGTIELAGKVPMPGYLAFPFFCVNCFLILFGTIHLCSYATLSSIALKMRWKASYYFGQRWFRAFARSCPDLVIRIGPFHVVDRARLAIVYRFCLQRTFFFIVYSRK